MASSTGGAADITDGQLNFTIMGLSAAITSFDLSGAGDYTLSGTGTAATTVSYRSSFNQLAILEVDGVPVSSPLVLPGLDTSESFNLSGGTANNTPWGSTISYDVNAALSSAGVTFQFGATKINVDISNTFNANSEALSLAQIGANSFVFTPTTVPVPEPGTLALIGSALCGFAMILRRRS